MQTRSNLLTVSSLVYFAMGLPLLFAPDNLLTMLGRPVDSFEVATLELLGCATFGFGMLNWMSRFSTIGGIFGRPLVVANFAYAGSAAMLLVRFDLISRLGWSFAIVAALFGVIAVSFAVRMYKAPTATM
jgi:hypothetical protein